MKDKIAPVLTFARLVAGDIHPRSEATEHALDWPSHLDAAAAWLCRAQDHGRNGGVSYGYSVNGGWRPPYVETTGYIAETFLALAEHYDDGAYRKRALRMLDWLCRQQNPDGSFGNTAVQGGSGIVFDTGQDLHGLVTGYIATGEDRFLTAARRAGRWLAAVADTDKRWTRCTYLGRPHVYNARVAWALLRLHALTAEPGFVAVAAANLDWAVAMETAGGYRQAAFRGEIPYTHTLAYTIRGLWEAGRLTGNASWLESAKRTARATATHVDDNGFLPALIDTNGRARCRWCCLTGNAQMAIIWAQMARLDTDCERLGPVAVRATAFVLATQVLDPRRPEVHGGVKGSQPIWGRYSPLTYPNWATKFLIDALLELK